MHSKKQTIVITTGGTGGHIFPAISLGEHLSNQDFEIIFTTDKRGINWLKNQRSKDDKIKTICLPSSSLSGNLFFKLKALFVIFIGLIKALFCLCKIKPKLVIGFGSYASFPTLIAALILRIPIMIHEQNAVLGKTNRFFAKKAVALATSFEKTEKIPEGVKNIFAGMPVRKEILAIKNSPLDMKANSFKILVIGGSQGANIFSNVVPHAVIALSAETANKIEVTQQCRQEDIEQVSKLYKHKVRDFKVSSFFKNIPDLLKDCHLVICRSGSSTIAELSVVQRPAVLVPLPTSADNHQVANAKNFCDKNGGWLMEQNNFSVANLNKKIEELINNTQILNNMSASIDNSANINSLKNLENIVKRIIAE